MQIVELIGLFLMTGVFDRSKPLPIGDGLCQVNRYMCHLKRFYFSPTELQNQLKYPDLNKFYKWSLACRESARKSQYSASQNA